MTTPLIPQISLLAMGFTGVLCIAVPIVLLIVFKNRFQVKAAPFFFGAITFIIFSLVLESSAHQYFLSRNTGIGQIIMSNPFLYAIYGGLAAGIFEEFGRFFCMMTVMKRFMYQRENSIIYGIGHGGIEAIVLGSFSMLQNLMIAVALNDYGSVEAYASQAGSPEAAASVTSLLNTLIDTPASSYILSGVERMAALVLQIRSYNSSCSDRCHCRLLPDRPDHQSAAARSDRSRLCHCRCNICLPTIPFSEL